MKFSFTTQELNAVEKLMTKFGVESEELNNILLSVGDGETRAVKPSDFEITNSYSKEFRDEINTKFGHVMTITYFDGEYQVWLCEEFFVESMEIYGDGIVEIIRGLQGIAKSMLYFVKARFMPFLEKWKLN